MSEYWKGIIASLGAVLAVVIEYTNLWNNVWLPGIIMVATALGVVVKANTKDGTNVRDLK